MTAAFGELTGPALRGRAGRVLCVLALVLPVPLFAALGLSLPLPATVERIAAKLVPFGDSSRVAAGAGGSISLAPGEAPAGAETAALTPLASAKGRTETDDRHSAAITGPTIVRPGPRTGDVNETGATTTPTSEMEPTPTSETERPTAPTLPQQGADDPAAPPSSGGGGGSGGSESGGGGGSGGSQSGGGSDPGGSQPVETVTNTANGAVETVNTAVSDATESVDETTKDAVDSATGIKLP